MNPVYETRATWLGETETRVRLLIPGHGRCWIPKSLLAWEPDGRGLGGTAQIELGYAQRRGFKGATEERGLEGLPLGRVM